MIDIIMIGSGGCMRELVWQILEDSKESKQWNIVGYVDEVPPTKGDCLKVGNIDIPYLGNDDFLLGIDYDVNVVISVGDSGLRHKIVKKYMANGHILFPNLILNSAKICNDVKMGQGCIITMDARVSTNVILGNFVFMNTGSMICHDSIVNDYVTFSPESQVAGAVTIGADTEIGMNATVIQCLEIGNKVIIGAGAVVIRNVEDNATVVGVPARKVR